MYFLNPFCTFKSQDVKFFPIVSSWDTICRDRENLRWPGQPPLLHLWWPYELYVLTSVVSGILGFRYTTRAHTLLQWSRTRRPLSRGHYPGRSFLPWVFCACRLRLPYRPSTFHAHDRKGLKTAMKDTYKALLTVSLTMQKRTSCHSLTDSFAASKVSSYWLAEGSLANGFYFKNNTIDLFFRNFHRIEWDLLSYCGIAQTYSRLLIRRFKAIDILALNYSH